MRPSAPFADAGACNSGGRAYVARMANLLAHETSPYLLQHADNPVHWRPWGPVALEEARRRDRPLLVSIGYAACHWCHVMAHESFEDADTAALMNALFVCVKIDREERPDIDHIYMSALHALGEQGGWPLTMFATPDGAPFWGGTYFPPQQRWGKPSFRQVCASIDHAWTAKRAQIAQNARAIAAHLAEQAAPRPGDAIAPDDLDQAAQAFSRMIDRDLGGIGGAPKFPNMPIFRFLWNEVFRSDDDDSRSAVRHLLDAMSEGGIYDHLGGGYARYSVDAEWLVPHFEKMLYDNAQALELLALAHADAPSPLYDARARETVDWMMREMRVETPAGFAFAAAQDADQDGEEGLFYTWRAPEIDAALGADAPAFKRAYDVSAHGNWEGRTILRRVAPWGDAAAEGKLAQARAKLFALREGRAKPARDDKVLADWNGLAIAALAKAACVFEAPTWLEAAREAFDAVSATLRAESGDLAHADLAHSWRTRVTAAGQLDDFAAMALAGLALFEAGGGRRFLEAAEHLARRAQDVFGAEDGGFYLISRHAVDTPGARPRHARDNATPAGAGQMAAVFAKLWRLTGAQEWLDAAERAQAAFSSPRAQLPMSPTLLVAADSLARGRLVVVAGEGGDALARIARACPDPGVAVIVTRDGADWPEGAPAHGRTAVAGQAAAYICENGVCGLPLTAPAALRDALRSS